MSEARIYESLILHLEARRPLFRVTAIRVYRGRWQVQVNEDFYWFNYGELL